MTKNLLFVLLLNSFCLAQTLTVPQVDFSPKRYVCYKAEAPLIIDGNMDESAWSKTVWTDDFIDIEGEVKPNPRFRTRVKMLWDEKYFYIAAEMQEPDIWAYQRNRDDIIFFDNDFEIFIDPDGDTHRYSEFEMNAVNTVWDLLLVQPYRDIDKAAINGWDIKGLKTAVVVDGSVNNPAEKDNKWTAEMAFPWEAFKEITAVPCPPQNFNQWRVNFSRVEWKTEVKDGKYVKQKNPETGKQYPEDNWVWSPQGVINMHYPEMWGYVQFVNETPGGKDVPFIENKDEAAKWLLRRIYYAQKNYFDANGSYGNDISKLNMNVPQSLPGFILPPVIECSASLYEARIQSEDKTTTYHIRQDGFTWIAPVKK
ncbi:MAG TPA: carbohydrate-binding family 9-like protein [Ignavibacteriales bacterium]|nr:carbohydrate-binding family 9-like protein [Ignavibacteriales bacterium]